MSDFLPVLLGSDANVYGMARSFYQQYGVRSVAICKGALVATSNTNLVKIAVLEPDLENDETFVKTLTDYAKPMRTSRWCWFPARTVTPC
ncbi:MAG: hypothetical protein ACLR7K_08780 [Subdoligranulum sp.]